MRLGVTGTSTFADYDLLYAKVVEALYNIKAKYNIREVTTGAAFGADTAAYYVALGLWPAALHRVCVPSGLYHNEALVADARRRERLVIDVEGGYLKRDDVIVDHTDVLVSFPRSNIEVLRSGTWATIRRGRDAKCVMEYYPLDGSEVTA